MRTRPTNGGLIVVSELTSYLQKMRGSKSQPVTEDDIEKAIKKLKVIGNGFNLLSVVGCLV